MRKTRNFALVALLSMLMLLTCAFGGMFALADGDTPTVIEADSTEWSINSKSATVKYNPENGEYHVGNIFAWGDKATYDRPLKLDGLKVTLKYNTSGGGCAFGFGFSDLKSTDKYPWADANAFCATFWPKWNTIPDKSQTRLLVAQDHNIDAAHNIAFASDDLSGQAFGYDKTGVGGVDCDLDFTMEFSAVEGKDVWQVHYTSTTMWENDRDHTFYFDKQYAESAMNENGEVYLVVLGFANDGKTEQEGYIAIEDANIKADKAAATAKQTAYDNSITAISDATTFAASLTAREEFVTAIAAVREFERPAYEAKLAEFDAKYTQDADVQAQVKGTVTGVLATEKVTALATESNITEAAIAAAKTDIEAEKAAYATVEDMLTKANQDELTATFAAHDAAVTLAEAKVWLLDYEGRVTALASVEKAKVPGEAETKINALPAADKTALTARITAADTQLAALEEAATKPDPKPDDGKDDDNNTDTEKKDEGKKGCGGSLAGSGALFAVLAMFAGASLIGKRKSRREIR